MAEMTEDELCRILDISIADSLSQDGTFLRVNEDLLDRYEGNPYGDELPERSKVISNDVMDIVEADMPSLARVFLGSGDVMKFKPNKASNPEDKAEAEQKTRYVNWQIKEQPWSFRVLHGFLKGAEIQKYSVVKYFVEEEDKVEEHRKEGISVEEAAIFEQSLEGEDVESVEIVERGGEENGIQDMLFRVKKKRKRTVIKNIPIENHIMSRNAESKDDAEIVGDWAMIKRGDLLAKGFDRKIISSIPLSGGEQKDKSRLHDIRDEDEGGSGDKPNYFDWALEEVRIEELYQLVDFDGDGIIERRRILRGAPDVILENEVFNHVPYALASTILMPHKAIGKSRAEITAPTAKSKTAILRGIHDNIYQVNNPQMAASSKVHMDDLLVKRPGGIVRMIDDSLPANHLMPISTPYIGDKALQVIQYMDQARAQTTGSLLASQGLEAGQLTKETATRFEGIEDKSEAKVELVARVIAETGMRELYEGVAWLNANFQDTETEIEVLGQELIVNPADWKFEHNVVSNVGMGAGDDENTLKVMSVVLGIQEQLRQSGSPLTDSKKVFNTLSRMLGASRIQDIGEFFNDPERPEQMVLAENEILRNAVEQLQRQAQTNPLAEAENVRAQAKLIEAQGKAGLEAAKITENARQFDDKMAFDQSKLLKDIAIKLTELEAKIGQDLSRQQNENVVRQV